jgi:hypothetical protein
MSALFHRDLCRDQRNARVRDYLEYQRLFTSHERKNVKRQYCPATLRRRVRAFAAICLSYDPISDSQ